MRLAISNIAWEPSEDDAVGAVLARNGCSGVELALTKWRDRPISASLNDVAALKRAWKDRGLEIVSLQSLFFGRPELQLFSGAASREAMADYLRRIIELGAGLGARALVFGSPKNRVRGDMAMPEAMAVATDFFRGVADHASQHHVSICIEANPPAYGCDFITTSRDAVELCRQIGRPAVCVNADLGGMTLAQEDPKAALVESATFVAHFHASEPELVELGTGGADQARAASGLREIGYERWVSIEMRAVGSGGNVDAVERAVQRAKTLYRSP